MVFVSVESVPDKTTVAMGLLVGIRSTPRKFPERSPGFEVGIVAEVKHGQPVKFADPLISR